MLTEIKAYELDITRRSHVADWLAHGDGHTQFWLRIVMGPPVSRVAGYIETDAERAERFGSDDIFDEVVRYIRAEADVLHNNDEARPKSFAVWLTRENSDRVADGVRARLDVRRWSASITDEERGAVESVDIQTDCDPTVSIEIVDGELSAIGRGTWTRAALRTWSIARILNASTAAMREALAASDVAHADVAHGLLLLASRLLTGDGVLADLIETQSK